MNMKRFLMTALATIMMMSAATAQTVKANEDRIYDKSDVLPEFPGGYQALMKFIMKESEYPKEAEKRGEQGTVVVSFVIEKNGMPSNFKIKNHATPTLDAAAIKVLKKMPKWKPGTIKGKTVRVKCVLPVCYKLMK